MLIEKLPDGRIAVTLRGDASGFYVWTPSDCVRIRQALLAAAGLIGSKR